MDKSFPLPLFLLIRVNALQWWRKITSLKDQSLVMILFISGFLVGYVSVAFWLFYTGLDFIGRFPGLGILLTERLLFLLFAFLFLLLLLSNLVISYSNLFRNRETQFLVSLPIDSRTIFRWKFLESALLASWAFLFLIAPLVAAFGMTRNVEWTFFPLAFLALTVFVVLPGVAGAWIALSLARYLESRTFQLAVVGMALLALAALILWFRPDAPVSESDDPRVLSVLDNLLQRTRFSQHPSLPSYWLSIGVLHWTEGFYKSAVFFFLVLLSHSLFFGFIAMTGMGRLFHGSASAVWSRDSFLGVWGWFRDWKARRNQPRFQKSLLEKMVHAIGVRRPEPAALLVKDARLFFRDTTQWGQTVLLFGLLAVYIINLRHFTQQLTNPFWVHLVSYLNLGACSLNLATVTTRFVFPQFSLEGKRLWILGMSPFGLFRAVRTKYWVASGASLLVTLTLVVLSCSMLQMSWDKTLYFGVAVAVMTFTLNGVAVGFGILYPNFKEENPSKIVSGVGGTFCLILSFVYILLSVAMLAYGSPWRVATPPPAVVNACWIGFLGLSMLIGYLPMKIAFSRLRLLEI